MQTWLVMGRQTNFQDTGRGVLSRDVLQGRRQMATRASSEIGKQVFETLDSNEFIFAAEIGGGESEETPR